MKTRGYFPAQIKANARHHLTHNTSLFTPPKLASDQKSNWTCYLKLVTLKLVSCTMSDKIRVERESNCQHQDISSLVPFVSYTGPSENIPNLNAD